jgi:hypothetical protein
MGTAACTILRAWSAAIISGQPGRHECIPDHFPVHFRHGNSSDKSRIPKSNKYLKTSLIEATIERAKGHLPEEKILSSRGGERVLASRGGGGAQVAKV